MFNLLKSESGKLLEKPGDSFKAEITKTGREVLTICKGDKKASITKYPMTGRIVETLSYTEK